MKYDSINKSITRISQRKRTTNTGYSNKHMLLGRLLLFLFGYLLRTTT